MEIKLCSYPVIYSYRHIHIYIYICVYMYVHIYEIWWLVPDMMVLTCNPNTWMAGDRKLMISRPAGAI